MGWIVIIAVIVLFAVICFAIYHTEGKRTCVTCGHDASVVQVTDLGVNDLKMPGAAPAPSAIYKYKCGHCGYTWEMIEDTSN